MSLTWCNRFKSDGIGEFKEQQLVGPKRSWICQKCGSTFYQKYKAKYCRDCRC